MATYSIVPVLTVGRDGVKLPARIAIGNGGLQLSHLRFQKFIRHDQRRHRLPGITTASRNGLIGSRLKSVGVGLWIRSGIFRIGGPG
jgi:hypothetical protein